ncbi:MAG: large conductance mechanosensitive channel protein MscL [Candidatus Lokiarchaeota archaeon]|nr:large conductance mechanosensitive channel protein MscL [Candidatus Lokiarchaeota archaeon]MBD3202091.1 large conductance mechanosensitive channel protein MscL [Candidatus Lokiarchaeota archaeon]
MLEELREIRKLLTPPPPPPPPESILEEFKQFLDKYKVIGLAVAFIMGIYLGQLVASLVNNMVMPIIELILPSIDWELIVLGPFRVGAFIGDLITFVIIAFVIFLLVKLTNRLGLK